MVGVDYLTYYTKTGSYSWPKQVRGVHLCRRPSPELVDPNLALSMLSVICLKGNGPIVGLSSILAVYPNSIPDYEDPRGFNYWVDGGS